MHLPNIIGLYAPSMGCGKSTVADYLVNEYGYYALKLAGPLKKMLRALLGEGIVSHPDDITRCLEGDLKEAVLQPWGVTPRYLMQTLGTEWGRKCIHPTFWTSLCVAQCRRLNALGMRIVVDDVRFPEEYNGLKGAGAFMVKLLRPGVEAVNGHSSEGQLNSHEFDAILNNNGTIKDLQLRVVQALQVAASTDQVAATPETIASK